MRLILLILLLLPISVGGAPTTKIDNLKHDVRVMTKEINSKIENIKDKANENYEKLNDKIDKSYEKLNDKVDTTLDKITTKLDQSIKDNYSNGLNIINNTNDNFYYLLYSLIGMFSAAAAWAILFIMNKLPNHKIKG